MTSIATIVRRMLRALTLRVPVRGRHRLVDAFGLFLAEGAEQLSLGGLRIDIDHSLPTCRHMYYGIYEEHLVNWVSRNIAPGDAIIEPGVNIGYITGHILARLKGKGLLIGLEPSSQCIALLQSRNDLTRLAPLRLLHAAVAASNGTDTFWETPEIVSAGYGYLEPANWNRSARGHCYQIRTYSIDTLMKQYHITFLKLLKLDIEGSELSALEGARESLARGRISNIMIETYLDPNDAHSQQLFTSICSILKSNGFTPNAMKRNGRVTPLELQRLANTKYRGDIMWTCQSPSGTAH